MRGSERWRPGGPGSGSGRLSSGSTILGGTGGHHPRNREKKVRSKDRMCEAHACRRKNGDLSILCLSMEAT